MEMERLRDVSGAMLEIGVSRGLTTRFLAEHMAKTNYPGLLYALDTFGGFNEADLQYEVEHRGKRRKELRGFAFNDLQRWSRNFAQWDFVRPVQADCKHVRLLDSLAD